MPARAPLSPETQGSEEIDGDELSESHSLLDGTGDPDTMGTCRESLSAESEGRIHPAACHGNLLLTSGYRRYKFRHLVFR